jgi:hypothetical protein
MCTDPAGLKSENQAVGQPVTQQRKLFLNRGTHGVSLVHFSSVEGITQESPAFRHGEWSNHTKANDNNTEILAAVMSELTNEPLSAQIAKDRLNFVKNSLFDFLYVCVEN